MGTTLEALIRAKVRDIKTRDLLLEILDTVQGHDHNGANSKFVAVEGTVGDGAITNDKLNSTVKMGLLSGLTTTDKANMVAALNEVRAALLEGAITMTNKTLTTPKLTNGGAGTCTVTSANQTQNTTISIPDVNSATATLVTAATAQTLTNKILTDPKINDGDAHLTIKSANQTHASAKLNIKDFTDENAYVVLEALAQTLTNKTLTTPVIPSIYQDTEKTKLMTLPNTASDTLAAIAATQTLTNKTLTTPKISNAGQNCIVTADQQTTSAGTVAIPNLGGTTDKFAMVGLAQTLTNKTLTEPKLNDGDSGLTLKSADQTHASAKLNVRDFTGENEYVVVEELAQTLKNKTLEDSDLIYKIESHDYDGGAVDWILSASEMKANMLVVANANGAANIIAPDTEGKVYYVRNESGEEITIIGTGDGIAIADGKTAKVICDGTDYIRLTADQTH